jgi:hypothetical protein
LVVAIVYIGRIQAIDDIHTITPFNAHRMVCTSFVLAYKYTCDVVYSNKQMALMGGISNTHEMNTLEVYTLNALHWNLHTSVQEFEDLAAKI